MQLKKLELCGFKSFAQRTEIAFEPGVTCIVGPNGCGKSNVVDAVKWVLGTLSYKAVRGEEMLDVIFKGAEGVSPMGFAEVSLTLDNSDKTLPVEYEEVTITRRMYRSGEGEYYLNRSPVRLRDIREMLYGTGIGTDNYSVIEQGKIDRLVLSNPRERRLVFDEAAGISRYRAKKREAEMRLDKVTNDLLRLDDIVREVQRELRSTRVHAGRAHRYRELSAELAEKRRRLFLHEERTLRTRAEEIARGLADLGESRGALEANLAARRSALEEREAERDGIEARCAALASELASAESRAGYLAQSVESSERRRGELDAERSRLASESEVQVRKETETGARLEDLTRERERADEELARLRTGVEEAQTALEDANRECARIARELERAKSEAMELAHKEAQYRGDREKVRADLEGLAARALRIDARAAAVSREHEEVLARVGEAQAEQRSIEAEIAALVARKKSEDETLASLKSGLAETEREIRGLRDDRERRASRRETLREFELQMEGLDSGAKELMRAQFPGVQGTLADFLDVAAEDLPVVEAALGDLAGAVVCDTLASANEAIRFVKERRLGRTLVLARDVCAILDAPGARLPAGLRRAFDLVRTAPEHADWIEALLGRILIADDPETAGSILQSGLAQLAAATCDGDVFQPNGVVLTGARGGAGILSRKSELKRLELEIEDYDRIIAGKEAHRIETEAMLRTSEETLERLRHEVYDRSIALRDAASREEQLTGRAAFLRDEIENARIEREQIRVQVAALEERGASLDRLAAEIETVKARVSGEIAGLGMTLARYEEGRQELADRVTQARVERAKAEETRKALENRIGMLRESLREAREARQKTEDLAREVAGRLEAVAREIEERRAEQSRLAGEIEVRRGEAAEAQARRDGAARVCEEAEAAARAAESDLDAVEKRIQDLRVEEGGQRAKLEGHRARAREEGIDLSDADQAPEEAGADWGALAAEVDGLRRKVQSFGSVNVDAISQLEELEAREKQITAQQEDLAATKGKLEDLIRKLNRESKELFDRTLGVVREHFNSIFRKLFGGGKADLIVEEAEGVDPVDQGLEIMAKPPAKDFVKISLLSGGERSLTALALVMALFRANPSPFCVLDEADAALDEKNVDRYAALVSEFVEETQFVIITHNKRTMSVADVMYGVTMETPGVSKKVAVDLNGDAGLDLLREKKIAARRERQAQLAQQQSAATAVLEESEAEPPSEMHEDGASPDDAPGHVGDGPESPA
ncbi:MAG: chromosome segregation protein SMC [Planctomycetes bacterium]|nr:chromosome segregation protein SMC [Planctomycetota bacterium]